MYLRAACVRAPLLEAYAEGKVGKAIALLNAGADPVVTVDAEPDTAVELRDVLPADGEQYKRFETAFGR